MGYTSYLSRTKTLDKKTWKKFLEEVKLIYNQLPKVSYNAGGHYKDSELVIKGGNGEGEPIFNDNLICFNGSNQNDLSHETFVIERKFKPNNWQDPDDKGRYVTFCKTARKPYDLLVCLCLISVKYFYGDKIEVSSDGEIEDWKHALEMYENITEKRVPENLLSE